MSISCSTIGLFILPSELEVGDASWITASNPDMSCDDDNDDAGHGQLNRKDGGGGIDGEELVPMRREEVIELDEAVLVMEFDSMEEVIVHCNGWTVWSLAINSISPPSCDGFGGIHHDGL